MQDAVMARMQQQMLNVAVAMSPDAVMKMWFGSMPQNPEQMREMFTRFFAQPFRSGADREVIKSSALPCPRAALWRVAGYGVALGPGARLGAGVRCSSPNV